MFSTGLQFLEMAKPVLQILHTSQKASPVSKYLPWGHWHALFFVVEQRLTSTRPPSHLGAHLAHSVLLPWFSWKVQGGHFLHMVLSRYSPGLQALVPGLELRLCRWNTNRKSRFICPCLCLVWNYVQGHKNTHILKNIYLSYVAGDEELGCMSTICSMCIFVFLDLTS